MKQKIIVLFILFNIALVVMGMYLLKSEFSINLAKKFISQKLPSELGIKIDFKELQPIIFPPGIRIHSPKVTALENNTLNLKKDFTLSADTITILFRPVQLISGTLKVEKISLIGSDIILNESDLKPNTKNSFKDNSININDYFKINIKTIELGNSKLKVIKENPNDELLDLNIQNLSITAEKKVINTLLEIRNIKGEWLNNLKFANTTFEKKIDLIKANIDLKNTEIDINSLLIGLEDTSIISTGKILGKINDPQNWIHKGSLIITTELEKIGKMLRIDTLKAKGEIRAECNLDGKIDNLSISSKIYAPNISLSHWEISNFSADLSFKKNQLFFENTFAKLKNGEVSASGKLDLSNGINRFNIKADLKETDIVEILGPIGKGISILKTKLTGKTELSYDKNISKNGKFSVNFIGDLNKLTLASDRSEILTINNIPGKVNISIYPGNTVDIESADLWIGDSHLRAAGNIHSENGWNVYLDSLDNKTDLSKIGTIAGIPITGIGTLKASIKSNQLKGTNNSSPDFDFDLDMQNSSYAHLNFGDIHTKFKISTKNETVTFSKLNGIYKTLSYESSGEVSIKENPTMEFIAKVNEGRISDFLSVIKNYTKEYKWLPYDEPGSFQGNFIIKGRPTAENIFIMSKFTSKNITWFGEPFRSINAELGFENATFFTRKIKAEHRSGLISGDFKYEFSKVKNMSFNFSAKNNEISSFQIWRDLNIPIEGSMSIEIKGSGHPDNYSSGFTASVKTPKIQGITAPPISLVHKKNGSFHTLDFKMFDGRFDFYSEYDTKGKRDGAVKFKTQNLDFTPILYAFNSKNLSDSSVKGFIDSKADLVLKNSDWRNMSGNLSIEKYSLNKGSVRLKLKEPVFTKVSNGKLINASFALIDEKSKINVDASGNLLSGFILNLSGALDSKVSTLFTEKITATEGLIDFNLKLAEKGGGEPKLYGIINLNSLKSNLSLLPGAFENINGTITLQNGILRFNKMTANYSSGTLKGTGTVKFRKNGPPIINASTTMNGPVIKFLKKSSAKISGPLTLKGEELPYKLSGILNLESVRVRDDFNPQDSIQKLKTERYLPRRGNLTGGFRFLDMDISLYSNGGMFIQNNIVNLESRGNLKLQGGITDPRFTGELSLIKGTFFIRDNVFLLDSGNLKINDPYNLNPEFSFSGESNVKEYRIQILASGNMRKPEINFNSQPPLSQEDIVTLLTLGVTSEDMRKAGKDDTGAFAQTEIGSLLLEQSALKKEMRNQFGINLKLRPTVNDTEDSLLSGRTSTPGLEGQTATQKTGAKLTVEKEIISGVTASFGSTVGETDDTQNELTLDYKLNDTISVQGIYEDRQEEEGQNEESNSLGVDLKFKWNY